MKSEINQNASDDLEFLSEVFSAQSERPASLRSVSLSQLTPFQRALLVIDGTVTLFIKAYQLEAVEIFRLAQSRETLDTDDRWLAAPAGADVIRREVLLKGAASGRCFAWAESLINVPRLSPAMLAELTSGPGGLGRLLIGSGLETRRECLWYGRERRDDAPPQVADSLGDDFLTRTYRVFAQGSPLMVITERFPFRPLAMPRN